jgi:hypothetical protein
MADRIALLPSAPDTPYVMGRHVHHDERSKAYPAALAPTYRSVYWLHRGSTLNQGSLGSCTGNALVDALMSGPLYRSARNLNESDAVRAYSRATQLDPFPGCHDAATEVLTEKGWRSWDDYTSRPDSALATVHPASGALEYQKPSAVHAAEYSGPMFYADGKRLNFGLTPNHRMWRSPRVGGAATWQPYAFSTMGELESHARFLTAPSSASGVTLEAVTIGQRTYTGDDLVALLALIVSDGWVETQEGKQDRVAFCNFRPAERDRVAALAQRYGITETRPNVWRWTDGPMSSWLRQHAYARAPYHALTKRIPELMQQVAPSQVEHFLAFFGDRLRGRYEEYYTSSPYLADDLQRLLLRVGRSTSRRIERLREAGGMIAGRRVRSNAPSITLTPSTMPHATWKRARDLSVESYRGPVYCATVPNGTLITRRGGLTLVSGNSYPPTDTGSDGLDACKAGVEFGWLKGYTHAFGLDACLRALTLQPVMIGIPWYRSMFYSGKGGVLSVSGGVAGGHEVALTAISTSNMVRIQNSWSGSWGINGTAWLKFADLDRLLSEQGDCTIPVSV